MQKRTLGTIRLMNPVWFLCLIVLIMAAGCQQKLTVVSQAQVPETVVPNPPVVVPEDFDNAAYHDLRHAHGVYAFYRGRQFKPLWIEANQLSERAKSMIEMIGSVRRFGLLPQDYHAWEVMPKIEPSGDVKTIRMEIVLTDALLSMSKDLRFGRLNQHQAVSTDSLKVAGLADSLAILSVKSILEAQEPKLKGYMTLKTALNNLLDTVATPDQSLLLAGITNDSIDSHRKVKVIEINLERWRTESAQLFGTYAWVNIPAYMFYVIEDDRQALESRVIVGKRDNETPVFSSRIECFTVFPYWYVPRKISVQEYLPILKRDTTFLTKNNFDVLDRSGRIQKASSIDWKKLTPNNFPYTLRQREGKENSLGVLKFVFDNPYGVFLHDTNAKRLFSNKVRALSHGCIRLEKAHEFAHYLIDGRSKITKQTLDRYLKMEKKAAVNLMPSVPIHVRYFTCEVRGGKLMIYDDIYRKDVKMFSKFYPDQYHSEY